METAVTLIQEVGFPIAAAIGLGYFVYYVWQWVTKDISPVIGESKKTLIGLIDKVRMLDNDMIRLNIKLKMILQEQERKKHLEDDYNRKEKEHLADHKIIGGIINTYEKNE